MSSTRKAKDDSVFHQSRYASSPEFERGLIANLVAKRCSLLDDKADRELIWFLQYLSHRPGGLPVVARDLINKYADKIQSREMAEFEIKPGMTCTAAQVIKLRGLFLFWFDHSPLIADELVLKGEIYTGREFIPVKSEDDNWEDAPYLAGADAVRKASQHPVSLTSDKLFELCRSAARAKLENFLREICLDPQCEIDGGPWYFPGLIATLREYQASFIKAKMEGAYNTALGQKVFEVLDYTLYCRGLTLAQGGARLGKSHAGKSWCEQHPGRARFVEVPSGNDEATFFRDLALGLGLGNFLNYKVVQIRERVESVLRTGDLILVLDEAQRLWPQTNFREGYPKRIAWVMTMANAGVPICMISTPQFFVTQKVVEKNGWNSAQLTGRISHYEPLPVDLSLEDLTGVAEAILPEADTEVLRALAVYARSSARYLSAIDSIAMRARYIADRAGRAKATAEDVRKAMRESVIPADTKLHCALDAVGKSKLGKMPCKQPETILQDTLQPAPESDREAFMSVSGGRRREPLESHPRAATPALIEQS